jgi:Zn-dependent peptidase ImmA (M78 family)
MHSSDTALFIDKRYFAAFRDSRSATGEHVREREANAFAAALLMPKQLIRAAIDRAHFDLGDDESLDALARMFDVSRQAMAYRVANLGLFDSSGTV